MIKVHVITKENRPLYQDELLEYHRQRYVVFAERHQWGALQNTSLLDIDAYDCCNAVHLIAMKEKKVVGGLRLNHAAGPTLLKDVFQSLVQMKFDYSESRMVDCTRLFISPDCQDRVRWSLEAATLYCAVMEYALISEVQGISFVCYLELVNLLSTIGWYSKPMGVPQIIDKKLTIAAQLAVNVEALNNVRKRTGISETVLTSRSGAITRISDRKQLFLEEIGNNEGKILEANLAYH